MATIQSLPASRRKETGTAACRRLRRSGLVRSSKLGRTRTYELAPLALRTAEHWLARQRATWERRLDQLDRYLQTLDEEPS